ncbi:CD59 glycoprotein [Talpa occidentalis]|uniref:CD59 glycoprotein n=1 Tax=Talpa occidentalis TaxID=50954 RepID=UPI00188E9A7A|nr:CD59 glycoprotein [Talpa occidentalis]XP_037378381.1 CD59 glycoprotein [Talpa occidentalis]XP_037378382.1 CD59 glycoprotein [Talpa occidentalis]
MGNKGRFIMLGLLLILAVLCHSGHSLQCFHCIKPTKPCTNNNTCLENFDRCLTLIGGKSKYFRCWHSSQCNFLVLSEQFGEMNLKYHCCSEDLCNKDPTSSSSKSVNTAPLVAPVLAVAWRLCL